MKNGQTIDIVNCDEQARLDLRRVKVKSLRRAEGRVQFVGVNMKGERPRDYDLPAKPLPEFKRAPNLVGWMLFDETDTGE